MELQPSPLGYLETQSRLPVSLTRPILIGQRQPRPTLPPGQFPRVWRYLCRLASAFADRLPAMPFSAFLPS